MNTLILNTIILLGLKTNILKASVIFSAFGLLIINWLSNFFPDYFLGVTIFLWLIYVITVMLDWATGISAARFEAKVKKEEFVFDRLKSSTSWFKHALFIIVIASIYHFQEEAARKEFSLWVINGLTAIQFIYFGYNMMTEWVSIEDNRFRINGKKSRLSNILSGILDILDKGLFKKLKELTKTN